MVLEPCASEEPDPWVNFCHKGSPETDFPVVKPRRSRSIELNRNSAKPRRGTVLLFVRSTLSLFLHLSSRLAVSNNNYRLNAATTWHSYALGSHLFSVVPFMLTSFPIQSQSLAPLRTEVTTTQNLREGKGTLGGKKEKGKNNLGFETIPMPSSMSTGAVLYTCALLS